MVPQTVMSFLSSLLFYLVPSVTGVQLGSPLGYASLIFPAYGITLALIHHWGRPALFGAFAGVLSFNFWLSFSVAGETDFLNILFLSLFNILQLLVGAFWLKRLAREKDDLVDLVTAFIVRAPILCLLSSSLSVGYLFAVGITTEQAAGQNWLFWWIGDFMGIVMFFPLVSILLDKTVKQDKEKRLRLIVVSALMFSLVLAVHTYSYDQLHKHLQITHVAQADEFLGNVENMYLANEEILASLARAFEIFGGAVGYREFTQLSQSTLNRYPHLQALSWNPVVSNARRGAAENYLRQQQRLDDFSFREKIDGQMQVSGTHPRYVVVGFITPREDNLKALGFDIASNPDRLAAIEQAASLGLTVATAPIDLVQEQGSQKGYLLLHPITDSEKNRFAEPEDLFAGTTGAFVVAVLRAGDMLETSLPEGFSDNFLIRVVDRAPKTDAETLIYSNTPDKSEDIYWHRQSALHIWQKSFHYAERYWDVYIDARPELLAGNFPLPFLMMNLLSMVVMGVGQLTMIFFSISSIRIEKEVARQTVQINSQKERLQEIIWATNAGTWQWNVETGEVEINETWAEIIGYALEQLEPVSIQTWINMAHPDDLQRSNDELQKVFNGEKQFYECEIRMQHRLGHWVWILDRGKIIKRKADGSPLLMSGTHTDITEKKIYQDKLEDTVAERTHDLTLAKEAAESANHEKTHFLGNISHELRTPMHGIMSFANIGLKKSSDDAINRYFSNIRESATRLMRLINDLLDITKLEAGKMEVDMLQSSLAEVLNQETVSLQGLAVEKNIRFSLNTDEAVGCFDSNLMRQVVSNLISNAIKFSPADSEITLDCHSFSMPDNAQWLRLSVRDRGIGVPEAEQKHIFDRFYESSKTRSGSGGTGLGLSICQEIIRLHNGIIKVESPLADSEPGSAFIVEIPATQPGAC